MKPIRLKLFGKFIFAFVSVGLLPILLIGFYTSSRLRENTHKMFSDTYGQAAVYGIRSVDGVINRYNDLSKILYTYDPETSDITLASDGQGLARILKTGAGAIEQYRKKTVVENFLKHIYYSDRYILSAFFVERDETVYSFSQQRRGIIDHDEFLNTVKFGSVPELTNRLIILPTHDNSYIQRKTNEVFTVGRNYLDLSFNIDYYDEILGTLYIDISIDAIDDIFNSLEIYDNCGIYVTDANGELIYSHDGLGAVDGPDITVSTQESESFGWSVRILADYGRSMANITDLIGIIYLIVILCLAILFFLSILYSRIFSRPIKKLLFNMKKIEAGDFDIISPAGSNDEMKLLADGLEHMAHELKSYIESSLIARIKWKEAELNALKTQIQPHYLYNSLETIRMSAVAYGDKDTAQLAFHLAKQMRYIIGEVSETVALEKELDVIRSYFEFIDICYNHRITYEISVSGELLNCRILKLAIQPVVENAVIHGLKPQGHGNVSIIIEEIENNLQIVVLDNGAGMDEDILSRLHESLNKTEAGPAVWDGGGDSFPARTVNGDGSGSESIGLKNVHARLKYKYGEEFGISVKSQKNVGTSVVIVQPLIGKQEV